VTLPYDIARKAKPWITAEFERHGYAFGPRAWAYAAEGAIGLDKDQFDDFGEWLADMRMTGKLPADIVSDDQARATTINDYVSWEDPQDYAASTLREAKASLEGYTPVGWWDDLPDYIEVGIEKADIMPLFDDICREYHVPYTNYRGNGDVNSRRRLLQRMRVHHEAGRKVKLIYFGDLDPVGISISNNLGRNLGKCANMTDVRWSAEHVEVLEAGLHFYQVEDLGLSWTDNLLSSTGTDMSKPFKPDGKRNKAYETYNVAAYMEEVGGARKVELNALATRIDEARAMFKAMILDFIPADWPARHEARQLPGRKATKAAFAKLR
jgi:hypothetical protein